MSYRQTPVQDYNMAFEDFAKYIAENGHRNDEHVMPITTMCDVCNVAYTYVVKTETLDEDANWLMKRMNITEHELLHRNKLTYKSLNNETISSTIRKMMSKVDRYVVDKLFKLYVNDFELFGYSYDFEQNLAGGWNDY